MKLLLHICCGPCATATVAFWQAQAAELVGFFYNPNIQPDQEYRRRLTGVRDLADDTGLNVLEDLDHSLEAWAKVPPGPGGSRCAHCIRIRLVRAAAEAVSQDCDAFSTTLAISPWQDHDAIRSEGARAGAEFGVQFLYQDLRPLFPESRRLSREWGLYRQKYCGCFVSEWERNHRPKARGRACS
jgi:epoxyqueuosine reductase